MIQAHAPIWGRIVSVEDFNVLNTVSTSAVSARLATRPALEVGLANVKTPKVRKKTNIETTRMASIVAELRTIDY